VDYSAAVDYLTSLTDFERLGFHRHFAEAVNLDAARELMRRLGDPHQRVPAVHIAGTKGKGSTAAMIDAMLRAAGYRTGLFTSPHLVSMRERIRVNGEPIAEDELGPYVAQVRAVIEQLRVEGVHSPCTFFEAYFATAALHFCAREVDVAVWEVGLGGRLDATNLLSRPLVSAITTIDFDHTEILGNTLDAIAREKAGIAKPGVPLVVSQDMLPEAFGAIREVADEVGAPVRLGTRVTRREPPRKAQLCSSSGADPAADFLRPTDEFIVRMPKEVQPPVRTVTCALVGAHQAANLGVALAVLDELSRAGYSIGWTARERGLRQVCWPGRFDVRGARPWLVFDCAHNPASARALARALPEYLDYDCIVLVVGMSQDKDIAGFAQELSGLGGQVILTQASLNRALPAKQLRERAGMAWFEAQVIPDVATACNRALELAGPSGAVCITGSFYVVGEAMTALGIEP
jgi:dihydrofolate synthase/folylpolyglutamate synthase